MHPTLLVDSKFWWVCHLCCFVPLYAQAALYHIGFEVCHLLRSDRSSLQQIKTLFQSFGAARLKHTSVHSFHVQRSEFQHFPYLPAYNHPISAYHLRAKISTPTIRRPEMLSSRGCSLWAPQGPGEWRLSRVTKRWTMWTCRRAPSDVCDSDLNPKSNENVLGTVIRSSLVIFECTWMHMVYSVWFYIDRTFLYKRNVPKSGSKLYRNSGDHAASVYKRVVNLLLRKSLNNSKSTIGHALYIMYTIYNMMRCLLK